jgi:hypothetical protein
MGWNCCSPTLYCTGAGLTEVNSDATLGIKQSATLQISPSGLTTPLQQTNKTPREVRAVRSGENTGFVAISILHLTFSNTVLKFNPSRLSAEEVAEE